MLHIMESDMCHLHVMSYKNIYKDQKCSENTGDTSLLHPEDFIERRIFYKRLRYPRILSHFTCNGVYQFLIGPHHTIETTYANGR